MITSIVGNFGFDELANYASSKGALESLTKSLAVEYAQKNVRINSIAPGFIESSYYPKFKKNKKLYKWTLSKIPMKRWGKCEELSPMIELLISEKSSYMTGTTIFIDGVGMLKNFYKAIGLIPVRLESKRLPGKALLDLDGLPIIVHTAKRAQLSKLLDEVYVCTDNDEIIDVCKNNKIKTIKTKKIFLMVQKELPRLHLDLKTQLL